MHRASPCRFLGKSHPILPQCAQDTFALSLHPFSNAAKVGSNLGKPRVGPEMGSVEARWGGALGREPRTEEMDGMGADGLDDVRDRDGATRA